MDSGQGDGGDLDADESSGGDETLTEDEDVISKIPGIEVLKVGVNFEDLRSEGVFKRPLNKKCA